MADTSRRLTAILRGPAPTRARVLCGVWLVAAGCSGPASTLDPAGPGAARIEGLWWVLFWISAVAVAVVVGLIAFSLRRARRDLTTDFDPDEVRWGDRFIAIAGVLLPVLILMGSYLYSLGQMNALATGDETDALEIEVIAHNWWWEVRYPNGAVTANEIVIPAGERVLLLLSADDVLHSFWVPRLQAKMDNIPGRTNEMWIEADDPGRYRGQCAEFCGLQHARMAFFVEAMDDDDFDEWYENEASEAAVTSADPGLDVLLTSTCVGCHAIRGTEAASEAGPDLTHLGARNTLFAGTLENTRENLQRVILDPQSVKPGVGMPPTDLDDDELEALLDYLEALR